MKPIFLLLEIFVVLFLIGICYSKGPKQQSLKIYAATYKNGEDSNNESNEKQHAIVRSNIIPPKGIISFSALQNLEDGIPENMKPQVISGYNATRTTAPYVGFMVANRSVTCGCSLISPTILLTAAHCVYFASIVEVYLGGIEKFKFEESEQYFKVNRTKCHEKYDENTLENDIALGFLAKKVTLGQFVSVIRLPRRNDYLNNRSYLRNDVTSCGYGLTSDNGTFSSRLLCVGLIVYSNKDCMRYFMPELIRDYTLCTQPSTKSICKGDSGGPLVFKDATNGNTLIGVVSFVAALKCPGYPNGFMRLTSFLNWIGENTDIEIV